MNTVKFTVLGHPQGKGRVRFSNAGKYVRTYTPEQTVIYENLIKLEYQRQCGNSFFEREVPLSLTIRAYYAIPKSTSKKRQSLMLEEKIRPTKKPDWDNIGKVVCDSLNAVAYHDDAQVTNANVIKLYSDKPRIEVEIQEEV